MTRGMDDRLPDFRFNGPRTRAQTRFRLFLLHRRRRRLLVAA